MKPHRIYRKAVIFIALSVTLAGCAVGPDVPRPTAVTSTAPSPSVEWVDTMPTLPSPTSGYIDMGHGFSIPAEGPGDCAGPAWIYIGTTEGVTTQEVLRPENLVDMGPREFAQGDVTDDNQGGVATYTVASGDVVEIIGERFCIVNGSALGTLNGYEGGKSIQPGDVLVINPLARLE